MLTFFVRKIKRFISSAYTSSVGFKFLGGWSFVFQGQKIHLKKVIQNLLLYQSRSCGNFFTPANFDNLCRAKFIFFLPWIFLHHNMYVSITFVKNFKARSFTLKKNLNFTNVCRCEKEFTVANINTLSRSEVFFFLVRNFLSWDQLYINNIWYKFQIQKIFTIYSMFEIYQHVSLKGTILLVCGVYFLVPSSLLCRFFILCQSFELEIWRPCYQHGFNLLKNISW